jgi:hypothetical protein
MIHFTKNDVENIAGVTAEIVPPKTKGLVSRKAFLHSGQSLFQIVINQFYSMFLKEHFLPNDVYRFLIIIHKDHTADIYVNDFTIAIRVLAKHDLKAGSLVNYQDIADIAELRFPGIDIQSDDCIIFCFKENWKFGLFYDFFPGDQKSILNVDTFYKELGSCYKLLAFQEIYNSVSDASNFQDLFNDGWFPFLQLLDTDYIKIISAYEAEISKRNLVIDSIVDTYDKQKIYSFVDNWWKKHIFQEKKEILLTGIDAYLTNTKAGYISCIKNLYPEIEGVLRLSYYLENSIDPKLTELVNYIESKASRVFATPYPLAFPSIFYKYLKEIIFKDFNLKTGNIDLSRNTISHGVAKADQYTRIRAFQAILTLDEIYFFLDQ